MFSFKDIFLLCLIVANNFIFTIGGYGFGHMGHGSKESQFEQSDTGVPHYLPEIYKNKELSSKFIPPGIAKKFGVKTFMRPHGQSSEDYEGFSSRESAAQLGSYKGGCTSRPETPMNARMVCSMYSGCRVTCNQGYQFEDGLNNHILTCQNGKWTSDQWETTSSCSPICSPPCQHNGMCIAPGQCNCPDNFSGPQCQFEKKPCLNSPTLPMNSKRTCTSTSCTISCMKGHRFPDGSSITNLVCRDGVWLPTRSDMVSVPDCQPVCEPPCMNGGNCLSMNICQCPQDFRGPQCQYSSDACAGVKLGFNGGWNCSGDNNGIKCSLSCPAGISFDSPPAPMYTCLYSNGVFQPQPIPQCVFGDHIITMGGSSQSFYNSENSHEKYITKNRNHSGWSKSVKTGGTYGASDHYGSAGIFHVDPSLFEKNIKTVESHRPKPGICFTWGGSHFKTFDGKVYSFDSPCRHVLVRDSQDNTFTVAVQNVDGRKQVSIFLQDKEYTLESNEDGGVIFKSIKRLLPIPAQLPGLRVQMAGHKVQVVLETLGLKLKWDAKQLVEVDATESLWGRTEGLCGKLDGNPNNDLATKDGIVPKSVVTLADSWKMNKIGESMCEDPPSEQHACSVQPKWVMEQADKFCSNLVSKSRFSACSKIIDISLLLESCKWDYCGCPAHESREACGCDSLAVYASQCAAQGVKSLAKWRDEDTCMMNCSGGRVYQWCGPSIQPCCGSPSELMAETSGTGVPEKSCTEGCFCPPGTLLHSGHCVTKDQCPCRLRGKQFPPGSSVPKDCNTCTCQDGEWVCTQVSCGGRCSAVGDPHYQTFDGKRFNFMGQCTYYLIKGDNYSIEAENVACSGAISEAMNLPSTNEVFDMPSCTKTVTIKYGRTTVQLKQGKAVVVNGKDVNILPAKVNGIRIKIVSSLFVRVKMPQGLEIWWDGMTRVYVDAPSSLRGKTKGLCGTFNSNQKDDFLTPEGDVEQSIIPFANKWKTGEKCDDMSDKEDAHPCDKNVQNKPTAERLCSKLKSQLFEDCHWNVDVEPFYEDCLYDVCACEGPIERCLCPIIGNYASECARQGVFVQWRFNVKECEVHCSRGQVYQVCGDSCTRTCRDVSATWEEDEDEHCRSSCVEGCNCPQGQAQDEHGECVPIASCPCYHSSLTFPPMYKEVRPGTKEQELCVCVGAKWQCQPATPEDIVKYPRAADIKDKCSATRNEEFTTCEPTNPLTCKNMHHPPAESSVADCRPGCQCKKDYVFDSVAKMCIKPEECPCHHGGRSYSDGDTMQEDCNTCKCNGGKWSCEKRVCAGVCSSWGDSHFHTFDGRAYDFQGVCTYLLTKGSLDSPQKGFSVEIQNEVCGTSGVTCSKAITLKVGTPTEPEVITFTKDKSIPNGKDLKMIKIRHAGLFVFAEVPSLGVVVQWDKGTRVYVRVDPKWKGRLKGLCGNYNDNEGDDFQTPSGGVSESSARLFGDSWKLQPSCSLASEVQDTCAQHPERKTWSMQKCGALKRYPFTTCHSEVPPGDYVSRCERDTCACGLGGDCECLCTALAAYAYECASRGVPIKWRSQQLCPIQCDETCTNYSPCVSTCPMETCDNTLVYKQITEMCPQDTCVEGCERKKKCIEGEVMSNSSMESCVPRTSCKPTCLTLPDGRILLEGDIMEMDECHTCHCSRGKIVCKGQPCTTLPPGTTIPPTIHMMEQKSKCKDGWSQWLSQSVPQHSKDGKVTKTSKAYSVEKEILPTLLQMNNMIGGYCTSDMMVDIECRTVKDHQSAKATGLEAECSLEKGLICRQPSAQPCPDFEIRVKCQCGETTTPSYILIDKSGSTTPIEKLSQLVCDTNKPLPHETDCARFYECAPGMGPIEHPNVVVKSCGQETLFNPHTGNCDWPQTVIQLKPECGEKPTTENILEAEVKNVELATKEYLRVLPTPGKHRLICDPHRPNMEHEKDCALFYHCAPGMGPDEHPDVVIKSCGPDMLFNPRSMTCDWPQSVKVFKPECEIPEKVHPTIGTTISFETKEESISKSPCAYGMVWSDCAVNCQRVCQYYLFYLKKEGKCNHGDVCIGGCVEESVAKMSCGKGHRWRDAKTCVKVSDCTCHTYYGKPVKPGEVIKESDCEICQCLKNEYVCDKSACKSTEETVTETTEEEEVKQKSFKELDEEKSRLVQLQTFVIPSTVSPPPECSPDNYKHLLWEDLPLGDEAFTASSSLGPSFKPQNAKLNGHRSKVSGGSWTPAESIKDEFIQVKLDHREPIYGILMQGSPSLDHFVTSYNVFYSDDGHRYHPAKGGGKEPEVFRGPMDNNKPLSQMFNPPFEAQYVKVVPLTWHDSISIRMELIGCSDVTTTTTPYKTTAATSKPKHKKIFHPETVKTQEPICKEPQMLMDLPISDVKMSSRKIDNSNALSPSYPLLWQPLTNSPKDWIQFDFGEPQKITGIITKGGPKGWVTAYIAKYSLEGEEWSPMVDSDKEITMFPANFDKDSPVINSFEIPIHARYLKILPSKWKDNIQMRIQPQGCHIPYEKEEILEFTVGPEVETEKISCNVCPGLPIPSDDCTCLAPMAYDGNQCSSQAKCPCLVGHMPYAVGATYITEKCETCTCTLGGVPVCEKKPCPKCSDGLMRSVNNETCECNCVSCPKGKVLCPTSEVCIPEESWCDGIQDCPDDEADCHELTTIITPTTISYAEVKKIECPVPTCPKGYKVVEKKPTYKNLELLNDGQVTSDSLFAQGTKSGRKGYQKYFKGGIKGGVKDGTKGGLKTASLQAAKLTQPRLVLAKPVKASPPEKQECVEWRCVRSQLPPWVEKGPRPTLPPCTAPRCPPEYTITMDNEELDENDCPKYSCSPPPRRDAVCNVTCRIFNTFDGTEFQYDICNHVLARDADTNTWDVTIQKNCTKKVCVNELLISQESDQVRFRPDLTVEYNGYHYTVDQTRKIGFQTQTFAISRLGDTLFYISTKYGFWVIYDNKRNVRIGVAGKLHGRVDGLCGFFNGEASDDRRKPDGSPAFSTEEFGDSWAHKESPEVCQTRTCPINLQNKAWEMCNNINSKIFSGCASSMNMNQSKSRCLEAVCECMQGKAESGKGGGEQACFCEALQSFITTCQAADQTVNLQGWRTEMNCPVHCPAPLVHYDCFRRSCELSCSSLQQDEPCPPTPGVCFSGCFCPEGMVRKGENCVPPTECRDCVCDGFGKPQYVTYDRRNFTFNGNCTYIASRDKNSEGKHAFEVYVTNGECPHDSNAVCTVALHIVVGDNHIVHIQKNKDEMEVIIDGILVRFFPVDKKWLKIQEISGKDISLLIPAIQLEVSSIFHNMAFSIRVPSMLYGSKTEGLCGDCDGDPDNDLGDTPEAVRKFGLGWRAPQKQLKQLDIHEENCVEKPKGECWPLPPDQDPCFKVMDEFKFGKCHPVVDPVPFLVSCQQDLCATKKQVGMCVSLEAYTRECARAGICLDWRRPDFCPYHCENNFEYKACGLGCQITCDNYEKYANTSSLCTLPRAEGCFCPKGKVSVNGKCIEYSKCFPCDNFGHYVGDSWQMDECTTCTCGKKGGVTCMERSCAQISICPPGQVAQQIAKPPGQCCPEFVCIPEPTKTPEPCEEPSKMECGFGQVLKLETVGTRCPKFVCQCKPLDECDKVLSNNEVMDLEPGIERTVDNSGCCPQEKLVCKPNTCPPPPSCPKYHSPKPYHKEKLCCPQYTCEPPTDKCLYDMEYESSPLGGEVKRPHSHVETVPKPLGASWLDGPCRSCVCKKIGDSATKHRTPSSPSTKVVLRAVCSVMQCPIISESEDFVTESVGIPFTCCPQPKYSACKHKGQVYKIGEEWKSNTNPCVSYMCASKADETLEKQTKVKQCDETCNQGWKYAPTHNPDKICCGECLPVACVVNGVEHKIGQEWTSKDFCTNYFCLNKNGTLQVQAVSVSCPPVSPTLRDDFKIEEIPQDGKCCKKIKPVACKVGGNIYLVGETWKSKTDPCKSYQCAAIGEDKLEKRVDVTKCNTVCKQGWKYKPSATPSKVCCGDCVPEVCVVNGVERKIGEEWTSSDFCTNYLCVQRNGTLQVQAVSVTCPSVSPNTREEFEIVESVQDGKCCKKIKQVGCKYQGKVYKIGETWTSPKNACVSYLCASKDEGILEKRMNIKECDVSCQQGWEYKPSDTKSVCCGECIPVACVVAGKTYKIGEEWTSPDYCTKYLCKNKNGILQVDATTVSCTAVSKALEEDFILEQTTIKDECCKKIVPVACKVHGEIYKEGSMWISEDPCKNMTCTRDKNGELIKSESLETCNTECALGWEYQSQRDPHICCGQCVQTACVVESVMYKPGESWQSPDKCTTYSCNQQTEHLVVSAQQESCPDISSCNPDNIYLKGCCKVCNITSLAQKTCVSENLPAKDTVGMIHQMKPPHGLCTNKMPLAGFKECKGACNSGTIYNDELSTHEYDCKCCQPSKYDGLIVELVCEDGYKVKKQVAIPTQCECLACVSETIKSKSTKTSRKTAGLKSGRFGFAPDKDSDLDDEVEMVDSVYT